MSRNRDEQACSIESIFILLVKTGNNTSCLSRNCQSSCLTGKHAMAYVACQIPIVFNIPAQTFITCLWNTVNTAGRMQILKITRLIVVNASGSYRTTAIQWERFYSLLNQIKKKRKKKEHESRKNLPSQATQQIKNWFSLREELTFFEEGFLQFLKVRTELPYKNLKLS